MDAAEQNPDRPDLSEHAKARMAERNFPPALLAIIYQQADLTFPGENGCIQLMVSRPKLEALARDGVAAEDLLRAARNVAIVVHAASDRVVTIYRLGTARRRDWGRILARGPITMLRHH